MLRTAKQAIALIILATGLCSAEPVIPTLDLEDGLGVWKIERGDCTIDTDVAARGKASLRIVNAGSVITDFIPMDGALQLSFWMKTRDVVRGPEPWHQAGVQVQYFDADRKSTGKGHFDIGLTLGTTEWTRYERAIYFAPKQGVRFIKLMLMNWNCKGTTWFDDVELVRAEVPDAYRKVPPLKDVENQPPRTWKMPMFISDDEMEPLWEPDLGDWPIHVGGANLGLGLPWITNMPKIESGFDIDRGYMTRKAGRGTGGGPGPDEAVMDYYIENFEGSPIVSVFTRYWLPNDTEISSPTMDIKIEGPVTRVRQFRGNKLVELERNESITLGPDTTKPFIIFSNQDDDAGVILFHPIPPEVRRWYVEDYVVEHELAPNIAQSITLGGDPERELKYRFDEFETGSGGFCHSFDFHLFWMPYEGSYKDALKQFQLGRVSLLEDKLPFSANEPRGYWEPHMSNADGARISRMARYFPREFTSWMDSSGWDYGHEGGFGWGCTTATMKGIRVDPNAENALARDYAWRMLTFFLEAAGETGAPPNMYTWRGQAALLDDVRDHYKTVFCQYWEWRINEFRRWLADSDLLDQSQKDRIYADLQAARKVYDPQFAETSWTYETPNGGYWFEYFNLPRGRRRWVINTHATSVGNVGELALMSREMQRQDDYEYWKTMFERGVDGLIYVWEQPDMWADHDPSEVLYARPPDGGPRSYHTYMVTAWTPRIVQLAMQMGDYRLPELVKYWRRMASAQYTKDVVFEDLPGAKEALAKVAGD